MSPRTAQACKADGRSKTSADVTTAAPSRAPSKAKSNPKSSEEFQWRVVHGQLGTYNFTEDQSIAPAANADRNPRPLVTSCSLPCIAIRSIPTVAKQTGG